MARRGDRAAGFALGVVLLVLTVLFVLALATGGLGAATLQQVREIERKTALHHAANGGLHELMDALYSNEAYGTEGSGTYTTSAGLAAYQWTFDATRGVPHCTNNLAGSAAVVGWNGMKVPPGTAMLLASASLPGVSEDVATVGAIVVNSFSYALAADGIVQVGDVTSPDGTLDANVRSNNLGTRLNVLGDTVDGQSFSRNGVGSIDVDGDGLRNYDQPILPIPDLDVEDIVASFSPEGVNGARPYGGPADFSYRGNQTATTDAQGNLTIAGTKIRPTSTVYVDGNLTFLGAGTIASGIHLFVKGNVVANGGLTQLAPTSSSDSAPAQGLGLSNRNSFLVCTGTQRLNGGTAVCMHLLSRGGIDQNGSSLWRGLVYVEDGTLTMSGSQTFQGVAIARSESGVQADIKARNNDVIFDPSVMRDLMGVNLDVRGYVRTRCWWMF